MTPPPDGTRTTASAAETQALGEALGHSLKAGDVVAFYGDLGAGKTCMIQGVCRGLGVQAQVNSPTFILIGEYLGGGPDAPLPVYHFDLYRLRGPDELEDLGCEEYFYGQGVCLIEWPERAGDLLPPQRREVHLQYVDSQSRRITLSTLPSPSA